MWLYERVTPSCHCDVENEYHIHTAAQLAPAASWLNLESPGMEEV